MIEEQLRDGLRAAVSDEPPLGFDPYAAADRAGRIVRRRRAATITGVATALLVVAIPVGDAVVGTTTGSGPAAAPSTTTPMVVASHDMDPHGLRRQADQAVARLVQRLRELVPDLADVAPRPTGQDPTGERTGDFRRDDYFTGSVTFDHDVLGRATLTLGWQRSARSGCDLYCTESTMPDGSTLAVTDSPYGWEAGRRALRVRQVRLDGSAYDLTVYNFEAFRPYPSATPMETFPLTVEQLTAVVTTL